MPYSHIASPTENYTFKYGALYPAGDHGLKISRDIPIVNVCKEVVDFLTTVRATFTDKLVSFWENESGIFGKLADASGPLKKLPSVTVDTNEFMNIFFGGADNGNNTGGNQFSNNNVHGDS
jgi:hypothetical protein